MGQRIHKAGGAKVEAGLLREVSDCVKAVGGFRLFRNCPEGEMLSILESLKWRIRSHEEGFVIKDECSPVGDIFIVVSGRIAQYVCGRKSDSRHLLRILKPGDEGGVLALGGELPSHESMYVAHVPSTVLTLRAAPVRKWMEKGLHREFCLNLFSCASRLGVFAFRKLAVLSCYESGDRILMWLERKLKEEGGKSVAVNRAELAEYLCVNRTALYRALSQLEKTGRIAVSGGVVRLCDLSQKRQNMKSENVNISVKLAAGSRERQAKKIQKEERNI